MKVVNEKNVISNNRKVRFNEGISLRYLLESDNMGFSLHKTIIPAGQKGNWHYKHHKEACFCIQGNGILTNLENGKSYEIKKDTCYVLDENENHTFESITDVILISVFNPPCTGSEVHLEDNSYSKNINRSLLASKIVDVVNSCSDNYTAKEEVEQLLNK